MPMHNWTLVEAGIFHAFHHHWVSAISDTLNAGLLARDYYALPDDSIMHGQPVPTGDEFETRFMAESDDEFYRKKKSSIVVRHVSGDRIVSMVEIISPGNKSSRPGFRAFLNKAYGLIESGIHLLIVDPFPPGRLDPDGAHGAIWEELSNERFQLPMDQPLSVVAYGCGPPIAAYIEPVAVGDVLPDMPLFLERDGYVPIPLELTYQAAFDVFPRRWRNVLEPPSSPT
jgi:Protein of unknown function (DUF4058)